MAAKIIPRRCSKCKETKPLSEFHKAKKEKNGRQSYCKICNSKRAIEYRKTENGKTYMKHYNQIEKCKMAKKHFSQSKKGKMSAIARVKRYCSKNPVYRYAVDAVNNAIKSGKLLRPDTLQCHYCPTQAQQYHHHNGYTLEHHLDVVPVCIKCHRKQS